VNLHFVQGKSTPLWCKAILSHPWTTIRIYTEDVSGAQEILDNLHGKQDFKDVELIKIPLLNELISLENYCFKFEKSLSHLPEAREDDILFYSGTMPQISILVTKLGYKSIMKYNSGAFEIEGVIQKNFDECEFKITDFFRVHGYSMTRTSAKTELLDTKRNVLFSSTIIDGLHLSNFGKIVLQWAKPTTSGKRKKTVYDILELIELLGSHALEHVVDDSVIEQWLKNINTPFFEWGEEE